MKWQPGNSPRRQRGFGFLEVMIVLIISAIALGGATQQWMRYLDRQANQSASEQMAIVADAASQYIKDNYQAVLAQATPSAPAVITLAMLRNTRYLPANFADQNSYSQDYRILALEPTANQLQTLIVTRNGDTIKDIDLIDIAKRVGAKGGYISAQSTGVATGSFGGWSTSLANYGGSPGAGHLATALFFQDGAIVNDYLYRNAIPGQPNLNRMNTAIDMGDHEINNAASIYSNGNVQLAGTVIAGQDVRAGSAYLNGNLTANGNITANGNTSTGGETYTGGWFRARNEGGLYFEKYGGGWYMSDPDWLRSYQDKNVFTGGEMKASTLTSMGRTNVGEYLQLNGRAQIGWGCAGPGLVSMTNDGDLLLCRGGVWRSMAKGLGIDQNWYDVTGQRGLGGVYQNTTGSPIAMFFRGLAYYAGGWSLEIYVNGARAAYCHGQNYDNECVMSAIIPPGQTYSVNMTSGTGFQEFVWTELR